MNDVMIDRRATHVDALAETEPTPADVAPDTGASPARIGDLAGGSQQASAEMSAFRFPWDPSPERTRAGELLQQGSMTSAEQDELDRCMGTMSDREFADTVASMTPQQLAQYLSHMDDAELAAFAQRAADALPDGVRDFVFGQMAHDLNARQLAQVSQALQGSSGIASFAKAVAATGDTAKVMALLRTLASSATGKNNDSAIGVLLQSLIESGRTDLVTSLLNELPAAEAARLVNGLAGADLSFEIRDALFDTLTRILSPELLAGLAASLSPKAAAHLLISAEGNPALLGILLRAMPQNLVEAALFAIGQGGKQGIQPPDQRAALEALFLAASGADVSVEAKANLFAAAGAQLQRMADNGMPMAPGQPGSFANSLLSGMTGLIKSEPYALVQALAARSGSEDYFGYELATYTSIMLSMGRSAELATVVEAFANSAAAAGANGASPQEIASITGTFYGGLGKGYENLNEAAQRQFQSDLSKLGFVLGVLPLPVGDLMAFLTTLTIAVAFEAAGYIDLPDPAGAAPSLESYYDRHPEVEDQYDAALARVKHPEDFGGDPERDWPPANSYLERR